MRDIFTTLSCLAALALAAPAMAQQTDATSDTAAPADTAAPTDGQAADPTLSMAEETAKDGVGQPYVKQTFEAWDLRCVRVPEGQQEPCQLYQLLSDSQGNAVAEISVFPLQEGQAVAGATIATPLETLLTKRLRLQVDDGPVKRYEFTWCSQTGCFARIGLTAEDLASFKRGVQASLTITPLAAPDQDVELNASLSGFTAGFEALQATTPE